MPSRLSAVSSNAVRRALVIGALGALAIIPNATPLATRAHAQETALKPNALRLVVVDDRDMPVSMAEVVVRMGRLRARGRTDSLGSLRVDGISPGNWEANIRRIGFNEANLEFPVTEGENVFTITMDPNSAMLKDVNVVDKLVTSARLVDFERRRAAGEPNSVILRSEIERRNPMYLSQMFRGVAGVMVSDQNGIKVPMAGRSQIPRLGVPGLCPMRIGVDGVMRPPMTGLDDVNPSDVHGIEVYYGPARLPLQLASFRTDN
ncbi:MAG: hypothetical protein ACO1Q7_17165, partial [Gemmatimonas sp.]